MMNTGFYASYLGYHAGRLYFKAKAQGVFVRWQRPLGPLQPVDAILAADTNNIYVRTAGGIYVNHHVSDCLSHKITACWEQASSVPDSMSENISRNKYAPTRFKVSVPPIKYEQESIAYEWYGEGYNETHYVRGTTGEIWVWQWGNFSMGMIGPFLVISGVSVVMGFVVGLCLAIILFVKSKRCLKPRRPLAWQPGMVTSVSPNFTATGLYFPMGSLTTGQPGTAHSTRRLCSMVIWG
jgi:hypothetical protein